MIKRRLKTLSAILAIVSIISSCNPATSSSNETKYPEVYENYLKNGGTLSYEDWLNSLLNKKDDTSLKIVKTKTVGEVEFFILTYKGKNYDFTVTGKSKVSILTQGAPSITVENGKIFVDGKDSGYLLDEVPTIEKEDGKKGNSFLSGVGKPNGEIGVEGDIYLDTSTNDFYLKKDSSVWEKVGNLDENGKNLSYHIELNTISMEDGF